MLDLSIKSILFLKLCLNNKQERKGFCSMIASSQFSNLQLAIWQLGNLAIWQLATWQLGNLEIWQDMLNSLSTLATFQIGNFQFCQLSI